MYVARGLRILGTGRRYDRAFLGDGVAKQRSCHRHVNPNRRGLWFQLCKVQPVLALGTRWKQEEGRRKPGDSAVR